jgi:hypothetical protein
MLPVFKVAPFAGPGHADSNSRDQQGRSGHGGSDDPLPETG